MAPLSSTAKWWLTAAGFAVVHFLVLLWLFFHCLDNYYDQPCPCDPIGNVLASPINFLLPLFGGTDWVLVLVPFNSFLWGCLLAEPFRWWYGWPLGDSASARVGHHHRVSVMLVRQR